MNNMERLYAIRTHMVKNKLDYFNIVVDSREKNILPFPKYKVSKLDAGDYSIEGYENKIAIERKSLIDLFGTLGKGHDRFKAELERAEKLSYFAIVIEGNFDKILDGKFSQSKYTNMDPITVIKILCSLSVKYKIPIFYCKDKTYSTYKIIYLFNSFLKFNSNK